VIDEIERWFRAQITGDEDERDSSMVDVLWTHTRGRPCMLNIVECLIRDSLNHHALDAREVFASLPFCMHEAACDVILKNQRCAPIAPARPCECLYVSLRVCMSEFRGSGVCEPERGPMCRFLVLDDLPWPLSHRLESGVPDDTLGRPTWFSAELPTLCNIPLGVLKGAEVLRVEMRDDTDSVETSKQKTLEFVDRPGLKAACGESLKDLTIRVIPDNILIYGFVSCELVAWFTAQFLNLRSLHVSRFSFRERVSPLSFGEAMLNVELEDCEATPADAAALIEILPQSITRLRMTGPFLLRSGGRRAEGDARSWDALCHNKLPSLVHLYIEGGGTNGYNGIGADTPWLENAFSNDPRERFPSGLVALKLGTRREMMSRYPPKREDLPSMSLGENALLSLVHLTYLSLSIQCRPIFVLQKNPALVYVDILCTNSCESAQYALGNLTSLRVLKAMITAPQCRQAYVMENCQVEELTLRLVPAGFIEREDYKWWPNGQDEELACGKSPVARRHPCAFMEWAWGDVKAYIARKCTGVTQLEKITLTGGDGIMQRGVMTIPLLMRMSRLESLTIESASEFEPAASQIESLVESVNLVFKRHIDRRWVNYVGATAESRKRPHHGGGSSTRGGDSSYNHAKNMELLREGGWVVEDVK